MPHLTNNNNIQNDKPTKKQLDFIQRVKPQNTFLTTSNDTSLQSQVLGYYQAVTFKNKKKGE